MIDHEVFRFTSPFNFFIHNRKAKKWGRGEDYLDDKFDGEYNALIGATRTETNTVSYQVQVCDESCLAAIDDVVTVCMYPVQTNCRWEWRSFTQTRHITEASDGLVTAGSQRYDPVPLDSVYDAPGVNHLEVGNHEEITRSLNDVFNRTDDFEIRPRI